MASSVSSIGTTNPAADAVSTSTTLAGKEPPNQQLFLQLLVAQIKNQDPMNPTDSVQFVSQLAQFSELEQVIAIRAAVEGQGSTATDQTQGTNQA